MCGTQAGCLVSVHKTGTNGRQWISSPAALRLPGWPISEWQECSALRQLNLNSSQTSADTHSERTRIRCQFESLGLSCSLAPHLHTCPLHTHSGSPGLGLVFAILYHRVQNALTYILRLSTILWLGQSWHKAHFPCTIFLGEDETQVFRAEFNLGFTRLFWLLAQCPFHERLTLGLRNGPKE